MIILSQDGISAIWITAISSFATILVAIVPAYFVYRAKLKEAERKTKLSEDQLEVAEQEIDFSRQALSISLTVEDWNELTALIHDAIHKKLICRYLILRGWNGLNSLEYTTAVHQVRADFSIHEDYIHYQVKDSYNQILSRAFDKKGLFIEVGTLDPSHQVYEIYAGESPPIKHSYWFPVKVLKVDKQRAIKTYCSISSDAVWSKQEMRKVKSLAGQIQSIFDEDSLV